jgi:hypothetical protein
MFVLTPVPIRICLCLPFPIPLAFAMPRGQCLEAISHQPKKMSS